MTPRLRPGFLRPLFVPLILAGWVLAAAVAHAATPPNLLVILADDMGVGDVSALNPQAAWRTPHLDRLAAEGRAFTDAHSASGVCTPTRYSLLTGRYSWRGELKLGVGHGYDTALIEPGRATIASLLRDRGYATAGIGKWHLGFNWAKSGPKPEDVDFAQPVTHGPTAVGFDYFYGIPASLDMPPYVYLLNDRAESVPDHTVPASKNPAMWRAGPAAPDFRHDDVLPRLLAKTEAWLGARGAAKDGKPFFLYLALTAPHTPISPTDAFRGRSRTTVYGDFVLQVDDAVGRVLAALDRAGLARDTVVIFTADNGCSPAAQFADLKKFGHDPQAGRRGAKADLFEGGHRVPFLVRWPGRTPAGTTSSELIGLTDLLATAADLAGVPVPAGAGEDSVSLLPAFTGQPARPLHEAIIHHSNNGSFAIRQGDWKLLLAADSGGWSEPKPSKSGAPNPALPRFQLYNLAQDPAEQRNLAAAQPEVVQRLGQLARRYVLEGRSTPGPSAPPAARWEQIGWVDQFPGAAPAAGRRKD